MKETIYTIPINEAFDKECSCALCAIQNKIESDEINYTLGAAMMEPDFRINSNEKGFCKHHYSMLLDNCKALPLALILQTYTEQQNKRIFESKVKAKTNKGGIFKSKSAETESARKMVEYIQETDKKCIICEKLNSIMDRYLNNLIYMWKTQPEFREKFASKPGFCVPHFAKILDAALKGLNNNEFNEFYHIIVNMQEKSQLEMYDNISAFTRLFDHNSDKKADEKVKNSIRNSIHIYSGLNCEND